jgi:hypothetical protein
MALSSSKKPQPKTSLLCDTQNQAVGIKFERRKSSEPWRQGRKRVVKYFWVMSLGLESHHFDLLLFLMHAAAACPVLSGFGPKRSPYLQESASSDLPSRVIDTHLGGQQGIDVA